MWTQVMKMAGGCEKSKNKERNTHLEIKTLIIKKCKAQENKFAPKYEKHPKYSYQQSLILLLTGSSFKDSFLRWTFECCKFFFLSLFFYQKQNKRHNKLKYICGIQSLNYIQDSDHWLRISKKTLSLCCVCELFLPSCPEFSRCSPRSQPNTLSRRIPLCFSFCLVGLDFMKVRKKVISFPCFLDTAVGDETISSGCGCACAHEHGGSQTLTHSHQHLNHRWQIFIKKIKIYLPDKRANLFIRIVHKIIKKKKKTNQNEYVTKSCIPICSSKF